MITRAIVLALAAGVIVGGCAGSAQPPEEVRVVRTMTVTNGDEANRGSYSGEIRARYESDVGFRTSGRVSNRLVEVGARVSRGQLLMTVDPTDARLNVTSARAQLASARSEHAQKELDFKRLKGLREQNFASQAELDRAQVELDSAHSQLIAAEAEYGLAANEESYTQLRAPQAGVVMAIHAEVGEVIAPGQPAVDIAADGEREVAISIPESRLTEVRDAAEVKVALWARPGVWYAGRVREIAPITDSATRQYAARVTILEADAQVELGMTARVTLSGAATASAFRLPLTAIYTRDGRSFIWRVDPASSRAQTRPVELLDVEEDAALVSRGVTPGDVVVTAGVHLLFEGQKVRGAAGRRAQEG